MVLLQAPACVPASLLKLAFNCTCGPCKVSITNDKIVEEQEDLKAAPQQIEMSEPLTPTATKARKRANAHTPNSTRQVSEGNQFEGYHLSTESCSGGSSGSDSLPKDRADSHSQDSQDSWFTPTDSVAECLEVEQSSSGRVEAAVAAALAPAADATPERMMRHRHSDEIQMPPHRSSAQDWWSDAETRIVPGLEEAPSLTRLRGAEVILHPGLGKSQRRKPWLQGESHSCYRRLGAREASSSYVAIWLNVGEGSLLSLSEVIDRPAVERCLANDPLNKRLKLLIRAVKTSLPIPGKGPMDADTVGTFFGKGASLSRGRNDEGSDIIVVQIDLYYLMLLRFAFSTIGLRQGNVVDLILVDWPGQAVLASIRLSVTEEILKLKG